MWTLGRDKPVIPEVAFIRWAMAFPHTTTGSLSPTFVSVRPVGLCSQALLCLCTQWLISKQPERTFGRLRYLLGGDRPSQTARLTVSSRPFQGWELEFQHTKGGIPRAAPPRLASRVHSLPPILYMVYRNSVSGYSKALRGLSVLLRVTRIFTGTAISPNPSSRQRSSRYAFHARRNLPDKVFRYLRTVIVTAAVHRGLSSELRRPKPANPSL